jgi:hypothetical protein
MPMNAGETPSRPVALAVAVLAVLLTGLCEPRVASASDVWHTAASVGKPVALHLDQVEVISTMAPPLDDAEAALLGTRTLSVNVTGRLNFERGRSRVGSPRTSGNLRGPPHSDRRFRCAISNNIPTIPALDRTALLAARSTGASMRAFPPDRNRWRAARRACIQLIGFRLDRLAQRGAPA